MTFVNEGLASSANAFLANGTTSHVPLDAGRAPSPPGPRIPRREVWLELPSEVEELDENGKKTGHILTGYPGCRLKVWVNHPRRLYDDLNSNDQERMSGALQKMALQHNGWTDDDGTVLPEPNTAAFWDSISNELAGVILILLRNEAGKLANSLATRSGR